MEMIKSRYNQALDSRLYFYRDTLGHEVDLIYQKGSRLMPIEIKSGKTLSSSFLSGLQYFHKQTNKADDGIVIYRGKQNQKIGKFQLFTAEKCSQLI